MIASTAVSGAARNLFQLGCLLDKAWRLSRRAVVGCPPVRHTSCRYKFWEGHVAGVPPLGYVPDYCMGVLLFVDIDVKLTVQ